MTDTDNPVCHTHETEQQKPDLEAERTSKKKKAWFVYIVRCNDDSLYTGITTDIDRRLAEHNGTDLKRQPGLNNSSSTDAQLEKRGRDVKGASYTRSRRPVTLVYVDRAADRSAASRREWQIKRLSRRAKERLFAPSSP